MTLLTDGLSVESPWFAGAAPNGEGVVVVTRSSKRRRRAYCTCGWVGTARLLFASAKVDALSHAAQDGCVPARPLNQPHLETVAV